MYYSKENVDVIVFIKDISESLKFEDVKMKKLTQWNWIINGFLVISVYTLFTLFHGYYMLLDILNFFSDSLILIMYLNVIYIIGIIRLLKASLENLRDRIESFENSSNDDFNSDEMYLMCKKIFTAFNIHAKIFRFMVSSFKVITARNAIK